MGARETALAGNGELLQASRSVLGRILDLCHDRSLVLHCGQLGRDQAENDSLVLTEVASEGAEVLAGSLILPLEEVDVDVELAEEGLGDWGIALLGTGSKELRLRGRTSKGHRKSVSGHAEAQE